MIIKTGLGLLFAAALMAATGAARAQTDDAEALMRKSGLWQQLATMGPQVRDGLVTSLTRSNKPPSAAELERLIKAADMAYAAERLRATVRSRMAQGLQPQHLGDLRAWFDSARGAAVARLEAEAASDDREPAVVVQDGLALLGKAEGPRRAMLERLVLVSRAAQALTDLTINSSLAVAQGVISAHPGGPGPSLQDFRQTLQAQRPQLMATFATVALAGYAKAYVPLSDADLAAYLAFLESAAGEHFTELSLAAIDAALVEAAAAFGRGIPGAADRANT